MSQDIENAPSWIQAIRVENFSCEPRMVSPGSVVNVRAEVAWPPADSIEIELFLTFRGHRRYGWPVVRGVTRFDINIPADAQDGRCELVLAHDKWELAATPIDILFDIVADQEAMYSLAAGYAADMQEAIISGDVASAAIRAQRCADVYERLNAFATSARVLFDAASLALRHDSMAIAADLAARSALGATTIRDHAAAAAAIRLFDRAMSSLRQYEAEAIRSVGAPASVTRPRSREGSSPSILPTLAAPLSRPLAGGGTMAQASTVLTHKVPLSGSVLTHAQREIALLTERINYLSWHFRHHAKDHTGRRRLLKMVGRRRRLLDFIRRADVAVYRQLIQDLGLRY